MPVKICFLIFLKKGQKITHNTTSYEHIVHAYAHSAKQTMQS